MSTPVFISSYLMKHTNNMITSPILLKGISERLRTWWMLREMEVAYQGIINCVISLIPNIQIFDNGVSDMYKRPIYWHQGTGKEVNFAG